MSGDQQLERSVLERKDRDELQAIARAMSLEVAPRVRKTTLIDQILRATGVIDDARPSAAPRTTRRRTSSLPAREELLLVAAAEEAAADAYDLEALGGADDGSSLVSGTEDGTGNNGSPASVSAPPARARTRRSRTATPPAIPVDDPEAADEVVAAALPWSNGEAAGNTWTAESPARGNGTEGGLVGQAGSEPAFHEGATGNGSTAGAHPLDRDGAGAADAEVTAVSDGVARRNGADGDGADGDGADGNGADGNGADGNGTVRAAEVAGDGFDDRHAADNGYAAVESIAVDDGAGAGGPTVQGAQGNGAGRQSAPSSLDSESGNRRGRRRRGRDRDRGERETTPQGAPEQQWSGELAPVAGLLDLRDEGFGFVRASGYLPSPRDVYVPVSQVRRYGLRKGDWVEGASRPAAASEKYAALARIDSIGGLPPDDTRGRGRFEDLTPLFPDTRLKLEVPGDQANMTSRIVDLLAPIGKGQRGLIVSPPKAGKTTVMKQIAHSIEVNNPEVHLMVLLVDERPEEVTDMRRSVKGEVVASTFDRPAEEHTQVAELAIERGRRLVELGRDVVIILDGITRLARAYNLAQPTTGRVMSGGVDSGALYPPKKFFGSARNIEEGGSLTILATALVETGSRMDEVIFEEFKGTGNMELRLDRRLAERRVYPAIDVNASSTRHEELLFDRSQLQQVWKLRRVLNALASEGTGAAGLELLMDKIKTTRSNDEFLAEVARGSGV